MQKIAQIFNRVIKVFIIGVGAVVTIAVYYFVDWRFLQSEITAYPIRCKDKIILSQCNKPQYTLNPRTFKVLHDKQEVLYWSWANHRVDKLTKCAVVDRRNWKCRYDDNSAEF